MATKKKHPKIDRSNGIDPHKSTSENGFVFSDNVEDWQHSKRVTHRNNSRHLSKLGNEQGTA